MTDNLLNLANIDNKKYDDLFIYAPSNNELEKDNYYIFQENKELKENYIKLANKIEELEQKLKDKNPDVN